MGLPKELRKLLLMNTVSYTIFIYIGIFVNLYIWEQEHKIFDVSWFNLFVFTAWGFAFAAGAHWLKQWSIRLLFGLSALSGGTAFLLLSFLQLDNRLLWIAMIGVPVGMMWGFASSAQNLSVSMFGKGRDFGNYFAASNTISQLLSMIVPVISAQVIKWFGYDSSFILMLIFLSAMLVLSRFLPGISLKGLLAQKEPWLEIFKWNKVFPTPNTRWLIPSSLAAGVFLQFQNLFVLLFTFSITNDKMIIALLNTLYTLCSLFSLYLYRKMHLREQTWLFISITLLAAGFLVVLYPESLILVISNILTTIGMFYFSSSWNGQHFRLISGFSAIQQSRMMVWRECLLCISRCAMLLIILHVPDFKGVAFILVIALALINLLLIPYFQYKAMQGKEPEDDHPGSGAAISADMAAVQRSGGNVTEI